MFVRDEASNDCFTQTKNQRQDTRCVYTQHHISSTRPYIRLQFGGLRSEIVSEISKLPAQKLPTGSLGNALDDGDVVKVLEWSFVFGDVLDSGNFRVKRSQNSTGISKHQMHHLCDCFCQSFGAGGRTICRWNHKRHWDFAAVRMGDTNNAHVRDIWVIQETAFELGRSNLEPPNLRSKNKKQPRKRKPSARCQTNGVPENLYYFLETGERVREEDIDGREEPTFKRSTTIISSFSSILTRSPVRIHLRRGQVSMPQIECARPTRQQTIPEFCQELTG